MCEILKAFCVVAEAICFCFFLFAAVKALSYRSHRAWYYFIIVTFVAFTVMLCLAGTDIALHDMCRERAIVLPESNHAL